MFGQCLLISSGISILSTGAYSVVTYDKYNELDRRREYLTIFSIIISISFLVLFISNHGSESLVKLNNPSVSSSHIGGGKPPF